MPGVEILPYKRFFKPLIGNFMLNLLNAEKLYLVVVFGHFMYGDVMLMKNVLQEKKHYFWSQEFYQLIYN